MTALVPGIGGALVVAGIIGLFLGLQPPPEKPPAPSRRAAPGVTKFTSLTPRTRILLIVGFGLGVLVASLTGWFIAIILGPAVVAGLPSLLSAPAPAAQIDRLEAMEEWTLSLSGVLTAGVGLEQAVIATLKSTPEAIRPEVSQLVARLRARWGTEEALRAFADDLNDATGDLVASNLILGARRRGAGLASVLKSLAESVAADVRARRAIEADRAKPRATARWVTIITIGVLGVLSFTGSYIEPYKSPLGQLVLVVLLSMYVATLLWMRSMATGKPLPRFLGLRTNAGARS